ncbi:hypothetical protein Prudu_020878 [Prunus dulcis]|uniref:Uncharacterized protein n=3 Tax=Prunus TaxID=3754 RepID=A0A4Y1RXD8_PRUDU|nr:hypothetical protein Prudu_020878 [Prunus dulcis]
MNDESRSNTSCKALKASPNIVVVGSASPHTLTSSFFLVSHHIHATLTSSLKNLCPTQPLLVSVPKFSLSLHGFSTVNTLATHIFSFVPLLVSFKMGKNQAYKAMQRARLGSSSAGPDEVEDGMVDGSFHSPEWHAARLASLKTSHTITWEEYKKKQKEDEIRKGELEKDTDRMMREYRAQLDAERARKLANGRNHSSSKSDRKKDRKDKDLKKRSSRKRKHSRRRSSESSSSSSSSDSYSSEEEERDSKRSKSRSKRTRKEKKHRSRTKHSSSDDDEADGPVPLSRFFGSVKS